MDSIIEDIIKDFKKVAEEKDIKYVKIASSKRVINKIKEIYYDIMVDYLKSRGKELSLSSEEINNITGYDIFLEK